MKFTVLVAKSGSAFYTREAARLASNVGEQGETEGLLRHLLEDDRINVVYFGRYIGEPLPGLTIVEPNIKGFNEWTTGKEQREGWERDLHALMKHMPILCFICVAGYSPTMSVVDNPKFTTVQANAVRYQAPMLNVIHEFDIPRIVVNNDPRTYPKDQEMTILWENVRPHALLDQWEGTYRTVVGGRKYDRKSIWARPESWAYHLRAEENTDEIPCAVVAHAHIKDGCKMRSRAKSWDNVLGGELPEGIQIYGKGWEHYPGYDPAIMPGSIKPNEVMKLLARTTCCPAVSPGNQFYTGKVYVCEAQGCIPLLYGDGTDPHTWDHKGVFLPLNHHWRIKRPGDLKRMVDQLKSPSLRAGMRQRWHDLCQPYWEHLDDLIAALLDGRRDWRSREWYGEWGGYWPV